MPERSAMTAKTVMVDFILVVGVSCGFERLRDLVSHMERQKIVWRDLDMYT